MRIISAKVGTMPELIQLRHNYKLTVGKTVLYRPLHAVSGRRGTTIEPRDRRYSTGQITRLEPILFLARM